MSISPAVEQPQRSCLYAGRVMHARFRPVRHRFVYRVFSILLDIDELPDLGRRLRLFSHNRRNLFSFHDCDHGPKDGTALRPWIERELRRAGIDIAGGSVRLLCFPRILGYVFNPLSVWFCHHADGRLAAVLYEVRNTFGEAHNYLFAVDRARDPAQPLRHGCRKEFHVSPFIGMAARYRFRVHEPSDRLRLVIRQDVAEGENLVATHSGTRTPLNDRRLLGLFLTYPLMTAKVIAAIHWEAARLWLKGARYHARPKPPNHATTVTQIPAPEPAE